MADPEDRLIVERELENTLIGNFEEDSVNNAKKLEAVMEKRARNFLEIYQKVVGAHPRCKNAIFGMLKDKRG